MGVFIDHGLAFAARNNFTGEVKILVPSRELDDRLSRSAFFQRRRAVWFDMRSVMTSFAGQTLKRLPDSVVSAELDVELTSAERTSIDAFSAQHPPGEGGWTFGWFETLDSGDTYEPR